MSVADIIKELKRLQYAIQSCGPHDAAERAELCAELVELIDVEDVPKLMAELAIAQPCTNCGCDLECLHCGEPA